ncbi:MAG: TonB-dependent receptor plug domain-containing protein, partial [Bacteroidetes bacterium]|nr:TonB-dependent receptor plug domain-containing protein [Bacteroidota bacterium]
MSRQPLVQAFLSEGNKETTKVQELSSLLNRLAEEKGSFFLYEPSLVEGVKVSRKIDFTQKTTTILNEVLPKAKLTYEQVDDHNFVIKKAAFSSFQKQENQYAPVRKAAFQPVIVERTITGIVADFRTREPLIGVSVIVKEEGSHGTITDDEGRFTLQVPDGYNTLIFRYIGYETKEVELDEKDEVNVWLNESSMQLDEVVITAVGIEAGRRGLGYSVEQVSSQDIENSNEANLVSALSGKTAGVFVTTASGSPGASANIRIRGNKSINGSNKPLFVVDGVPIDNTSSGNSEVGVDVSNRVIDINPNDIQNISILKGPAATALYGIRAANGAVLITTKKGKEGKPRINIKSSYGLSQVTQLPGRQYIYAQGAFQGGNAVYKGPETGEANSFGPRIDALEFDGDPTYL